MADETVNISTKSFQPRNLTWLRWYDGTASDGKFQIIARNADVTVATVIGVWAILLEDASHISHRGRSTRGSKYYSLILDLAEPEIQKIIDCMVELDMVSLGSGEILINNWNKRQFECDVKDPTVAERQKRWREKHKKVTPDKQSVTDSNGSLHTDTDTDTDKKDAATAANIESQEIQLFRRAKEICGKSAGGLCTKLLKSKSGNVALARAILETASTKENPREYIGRIIAGQRSEITEGSTLWRDPGGPIL